MDGKFWVEVRVPYETDLSKPNLEGLVNYAFNSAEAVEIVIANTPSPRPGMDRDSIRWFYGFESEHARQTMRTQLETEGFYVINQNPPNLDDKYDHVTKLQATDHFAQGFLPRAGEPEEERTFEDYPRVADKLASSICRGGTLRMVFRQDDGAVDEVHSKADGMGQEGKGRTTSYVDSLFRSLLSLGSSAENVDWREEESQVRRDNSSTEAAERIRDRADTGLLTADIYLYGTSKQVNSVLNSLPFSPVSLEVWESGPTKGEDRLEVDPDPTTKQWKRFAKKWLQWGVPLLLGFLFWYTGLWAPLETFESLQNILPLVVIVVAAVAPSLWRFKNPIVFSHDELTLFVSLPPNIDSVPHEPGTEAEPVQEPEEESGR